MEFNRGPVTMINQPTIVGPNVPMFIEFHLDGKVLFRLFKNGKIERGPGFTTDDEMSLRFWELIDQAYPGFLTRRF